MYTYVTNIPYYIRRYPEVEEKLVPQEDIPICTVINSSCGVTTPRRYL